MLLMVWILRFEFFFFFGGVFKSGNVDFFLDPPSHLPCPKTKYFKEKKVLRTPSLPFHHENRRFSVHVVCGQFLTKIFLPVLFKGNKGFDETR